MSLDDPGRSYLDLVRAGPRPTGAQISAFSRRVADAHSWYKHLPLSGVGEPFFLFLDPTSHLAAVQRTDGSVALREVVRDLPDAFGPRLRIDTQPDDVEPEFNGEIALRGFQNRTSDELRESFGLWRFWNWGAPGQPPREALASAAQSLRVRAPDGRELPVPEDLLECGLVYLRGTLSASLGPSAEEYGERQHREGLPEPHVDRDLQLDAMKAAMRAVCARIWPPETPAA